MQSDLDAAALRKSRPSMCSGKEDLQELGWTRGGHCRGPEAELQVSLTMSDRPSRPSANTLAIAIHASTVECPVASGQGAASAAQSPIPVVDQMLRAVHCPVSSGQRPEGVLFQCPDFLRRRLFTIPLRMYGTLRLQWGSYPQKHRRDRGGHCRGPEAELQNIDQ